MQDDSFSTDRWLDVLAGKAAPTDRDTRQAHSLRGFFEQQAQRDAVIDDDKESQKRMLNALRARGLFDDAPATVQPRWPQRLRNWLFPAGEVMAWHYAAGLRLKFWHPPTGACDDLSSCAGAIDM